MTFSEFEAKLKNIGMEKKDFVDLFPPGAITLSSIKNWAKPSRSVPYWVGTLLEQIQTNRELKAVIKHIQTNNQKGEQ